MHMQFQWSTGGGGQISEMRGRWKSEEVKTIHFQNGWLFRRKKKDGNSWKETQVFIQMGEMLLAWIQ